MAMMSVRMLMPTSTAKYSLKRLYDIITPHSKPKDGYEDKGNLCNIVRSASERRDVLLVRVHGSLLWFLVRSLQTSYFAEHAGI